MNTKDHQSVIIALFIVAFLLLACYLAFGQEKPIEVSFIATERVWPTSWSKEQCGGKDRIYGIVQFLPSGATRALHFAPTPYMGRWKYNSAIAPARLEGATEYRIIIPVAAFQDLSGAVNKHPVKFARTVARPSPVGDIIDNKQWKEI